MEEGGFVGIYLQNCLEVESEPIPQCKLSAGGTSDEPAAFRSPLHRHTE